MECCTDHMAKVIDYICWQSCRLQGSVRLQHSRSCIHNAKSTTSNCHVSRPYAGELTERTGDQYSTPAPPFHELACDVQEHPWKALPALAVKLAQEGLQQQLIVAEVL